MNPVEFGRYRLIEVIGEGGMGTVYRAHDTVIGRDVAIKVLPTELASESGYRARFRREAQIVARLTNPHIIPIHDTGEIDGRLYLVMPIIDGTDLQTLLGRDGPMSPRMAVRGRGEKRLGRGGGDGGAAGCRGAADVVVRGGRSLWCDDAGRCHEWPWAAW